MRTWNACFAVAGLAVLLAGCDGKGGFKLPLGSRPKAVPPPVAQPAPAAAPAAPVALPGQPIRSEDATGVWTDSQVEQHVTENLKLASIKLESAGGADYRGVGVGQDGTNYSFDVKQIPGGIDVQWADDRGGNGGMSFGQAVP